MSWKELPLSEYKISYLIDLLYYIERNYNLNPLLFLGSSADCRKPKSALLPYPSSLIYSLMLPFPFWIIANKSVIAFLKLSVVRLLVLAVL
jgi:hypothetical protein